MLFIFCGALTVLSVFFPGITAFMLILVPIVVTTLFLTVYSYILYRQETKA